MRRLAALALASCAGGGCGDGAVVPSATASTTARAPTVEIVDLSGVEAALAKHRGRGVLLNFWAIWCEPCVAELPELMEVAREFREQGGDVLLVSYDLMVPNQGRDAVRERVAKFVALRGFESPVLIYDGPDFDAINERFDLPGAIPVTLAFDREGKLVDRDDEQADKARFAEMMRKALAR